LAKIKLELVVKVGRIKAKVVRVGRIKAKGVTIGRKRKLKLKRDNIEREVVALINSGYEADSPQLMIPVSLARELRLWPPPIEARETVFETAGGSLRVWIIPRVAITSVVTEDVESKTVEVDIVVSQLADEPLISDVLAGSLELAVEDFAEGLWRFRWEPKERVRKSEPRQVY